MLPPCVRQVFFSLQFVSLVRFFYVLAITQEKDKRGVKGLEGESELLRFGPIWY